jgi:hypothetical protein
VKDIHSADEAALWAHRRLPEKNTLVVADAQRVEENFRTKLTSFTVPAAEAVPPAGTTDRTTVIDKSMLALSEPRRVRDREHVKYVAKQSCLVCGRKPCDPHHLRFAQSRALGRKVSDEFTVPLCRGHHREVHRHGDEAAWWNKSAIDPMVAARSLWIETHPQLVTQTPRPVDAISKGPNTSGARRTRARRGRVGHKTCELRNEANLPR